MKNSVLFLAFAIFGASSLKAQLNVGSTSAADASAILQATSTTKGFLPPVLTTAQITAIVLPANGLTVYNSTLSQLQVNVGTPAAPSWSIAAGSGSVYWSQQGNANAVPGSNYVGTTDNNSLGFRTNGVERVRIDSSTGNVGIGTTTPYAPLQFANKIANRIIVLADGISNAGNDSSFYGFGINGSTLRYQAPGNSNHAFYNNKTLVANLTTSSIYLKATNVNFDSSPLIGSGDSIFVNGIGVTANGGLNMGQNNSGLIAIGYKSGRISSGFSNMYIGYKAGYNCPAGLNNNQFIGYYSGFANTGYENTFSGSYSGTANTTGIYNTYTGFYSGLVSTTGSNNTFTGWRSGWQNTTGGGNIFFGGNAGQATTTGGSNNFFGYNSGFNNTTGNSNTAIGDQAGPNTGNLTNTTSIGAGTRATVSNTVILGNSANVGINTSTPTSTLSVNGSADKAGGGSWGTFSDERLKKNIIPYSKGLKEIMAIKPVSFQYNGDAIYSDDGKRYVGILAQQIEKVLPSTVTQIKQGKYTDLRKYDGSELTYTLINAIQEQQAQNDTQVAISKAQAAEIASLKKENLTIAAQLADMKDLKIAMAAMQTELTKIAVTTKVAASNIASK